MKVEIAAIVNTGVRATVVFVCPVCRVQIQPLDEGRGIPVASPHYKNWYEAVIDHYKKHEER